MVSSRKSSYVHIGLILISCLCLAPCGLSAAGGPRLGASSLLVGSTGGTASVVLTYGGTWTATANDSFLNIASGSTSGTGSAVVAFNYDAFTGEGPRTGTLTIAGQTVTVTQAGANYIGPAAVPTVLWPGLDLPAGVAVDSAGNVYIADSGTGAIYEWNASTQQMTALVTAGLNAPQGVAVDGAGNVYIADTGNNAIKKWSAATGQVTMLVASGLASPQGAAVDGGGNVYIADTGNNAIEKWSAATGKLSALVSSGLASPVGVTVDGAGNLYIADNKSDAIVEWNAATGKLTTPMPSGLASPEGAAVDGAGNVYVADWGNRAIREWNAATLAMTTLASSGLASPKSVAVDGFGNVYIADPGNHAIEEIPYAFVGPASLTEAAGAGTDSLLPVLPATASLNGVYSPSSDSSWLTIGSVENGIVSFSFTANLSAVARTAHITVLGQQIAVTQSGSPSLLGAGRHIGATVNQTISFSPLTATMLVGNSQLLSATATSGLTVAFASLPSSVCSVNTVLTASGAAWALFGIGPGTCTVTASQAGGGNYKAAPDVSQTVQVLESQTITGFHAIGGGHVGDTQTPAATASSGLPVSFNSQTNDKCTVSGSTVTLVAVGTCTVQATQAGDGVTWAAATPVTISGTVLQGTQTIINYTLNGPTTEKVGDQYTIGAFATSNLPVSFTSLTPSVCTLSGTSNGSTLTLIATGSCAPQATQAGNANWAAATPVSLPFTVHQGTQTISFPPLISEPVNYVENLNATASSGLAVSFASTTPTVCSVPTGGMAATGLKIGTCTILASQAGSANYAAAPTQTQSFQVTGESQTIAFNVLTTPMAVGSSQILEAVASSGLSVTFQSQTTSVCTVGPVHVISGHSAGSLTAVAGGTCTVAAVQGGDGVTFAAAATQTQSIQVTGGAQTITFAALSSQTLGAAPFTVSATASSGLAVSYASLTTSVCTVNGTLVTLVAAGTCTIQATQAGNVNWLAATPVNQSFTVTTGALTPQTITFGPLANQTLGAAPFTISATASSGLPVSFLSITPAVCTVNGSQVTLLAAGTCTIEADQGGNGAYAGAPAVQQSFTVTAAGLAAQTITFGALANQTLGAAPFNISATATSGLPVSFASLTTSVCTVNATQVTLVAAGTCTIQATQAGDGATWAAATPVNQSFTVTAAVTGPTITGVAVSGGGANIAQNAWISIYGTDLAPASVSGGMTWSSAPSFASGQMPTSLDGVSVTVNGNPAYIFFICPTQINVLTPLDSTTGQVSVVVNNGTADSAPYTVNLEAVSPGFLRFGDGVHVAALHADYSYLGPASMSVPGYTFTPAAPGETISLFGDGFGLPVTTLTAGSDVQAGALPAPWPQVTIGGTPATVTYAGVISPGLYQINVEVPSTAQSGDNQVIATYGGATSPNGAMIPVSQ